MPCFSSKSMAAKDGICNYACGKDRAAEFIRAISRRRSIYDLGRNMPISQKEVTEIVKSTIHLCPSSFNAKGFRIVLLFGAEHQKVWEMLKAALKKVTSEDQYRLSEMKVNQCFAAGAGTILFYEDGLTVKMQQETYPSYAENFPTFSQHSSAMAQFAMWTALAQEGIGASLQHYNELIKEDLRAAFDIPQEWELIAQMPFGSIEKPAKPRSDIEDKSLVIVHGE
ncbi:hypothetical protein LSCM1_00616 [Leishmania martiniquensis]|uniref:Nitroreductase domain-containing protein n=1 Tax=Leishmania martiniquensis TaxID=1580590 RepID=A0A836GFT5_9TRYP|nr:hypothetical protein LSCM1_00616 [Leishmania martiniquensis]